MENETLFRSLLFDFYGELLTDKQKEYFDLHYNEDLSLGEIAEQTGTTRQAVWDIIRRAEQTLRGIEEKTGLVRRFTAARETLEQAARALASLETSSDDNARRVSASIIEKLKALED